MENGRMMAWTMGRMVAWRMAWGIGRWWHGEWEDDSMGLQLLGIGLQQYGEWYNFVMDIIHCSCNIKGRKTERQSNCKGTAN